MTKHTITNKFFLYRKLNKVFLKWKFFYNRYATRVAFFKKGFHIEAPASISQPTVNRTKDLTKMVFWLLNLTDVGYSNKLTQNRRNMNFEWELIKGEGQFIELYGDIAYTRKHELNYRLFEQEIKSSIINFFWDKHDVILTKDDIKDLSLNSIPSSKRKFLKAFVRNKFQIKNSKKITTKNIHNYFRKDMSLYKDKTSSLDFDPAVDFRRLDLLRQTSSFTLYDEIDLYINTLGYTKNAGVSDTDVFKSLVIGGHKNGRFKILPTYVANYDDPDMLIPGLGFHNYFKNLDMRELGLLKLFTQNSKTFMPTDGSNKTQAFHVNSTNSPLFYNYYSKDTTINLSSNALALIDERVSDVDYVMRSFLYKSSIRSKISNKELISFQSLYSLFLKRYNDMLFQRPEVVFFREYIIQSKVSKIMQNSYLSYDFYSDLEVKSVNIQNLLNKKEFFFRKHYRNLYTMSDIFLHKWNQKLKELFLLRVDLRSNWGYYFDTPFQPNLEEDQLKNPAPYTIDHAYKSYFEIVRNPTIVQSAKRPYKWTSIPLLQHSPFLYWMNNVRSNWFYIFDQGLGLFGLLKKDVLFNKEEEPSNLLSNRISHLIFHRYFNKNDFYYNQILKYMNSSFFFNQLFGAQREHYFNLTLYMDKLLSQPVMDKTLTYKGNSFVNKLLEYTDANKMLPSHFIRDVPEMDIFSLFRYNGYFKYGSSGFFEADWQTDYRASNMTRAPLLSKIGVTPEHFSFFSFFSRDFFEQAVGYKSWMKFRTFETPYMEEKTWREFTYLHQPLIDLTTDITLSRYKADLLHLLELGFHDIVFEKEIFYKTHYLSQPLKLRDVFEFQEFTAPFFFFDSERSVFGNVPQRLPFEYVSSFGIPLLDKHWMVGDVLGPNVLRDIDRGEWYIRSRALGDKRFIRTWRKDRMVHKFIYHNDYNAAVIKQDMHVFVLTSVKGSKVYDPKFKNAKQNNALRKPNVIGVLHNSVLIVKKGKSLFVESDRELVSKESIYLFQFERLYNQYMKSLFFFLLRQSFRVSSEVLHNFVSGMKSSFIWRNTDLGSLFYNLFKCLEEFSNIYSILENSLRYQQVKFTFFFTKTSIKTLINAFVELMSYFRMLVFIFKHGR